VVKNRRRAAPHQMITNKRTGLSASPHKVVSAEELRRYYETSARYIADMRAHDPGYFRKYVDLVARYAVGDTLLELGCGAGVSTAQIARRLSRVQCLGSDISTPAIQHAQWAQRMPNLRFAVADANNLPFADESFSMVASCDCLEHVPNLEAALSESMRVTKPGGRIIVKAPNHLSPIYTIGDIMAGRSRFPVTRSWWDNWRRLSFQIGHYIAALRGRVEFVPRTPDLSDMVQVGDDADAVTDMSTLTVRNYFRQCCWRILRLSCPRGSSNAGAVVSALLPHWGSMGVVAEKPARQS